MSDNVLSVTEVYKAFGPRVILDGVTFGLDAGDTIGLIGDNGTGKSTFLKIIAGLEPADRGVVATRNDVTMALLEQVPTLAPTQTVREILAEPFAPAIEAVAKYEQLATQMDPEAEFWLAEVERLDGWDWMHRLERVASQCNVGELDVPAGQLSGGQQKRVALARLILLEPDIILFDEPTNHLDAATVEWLEQWIAKTNAACIVVTHDRYFLENVVTKMAEIRDGNLKVYEGSYTDYLAARAEEEAQADRVGHRRMQMLKSELDWARRSPKARTTKSKSRLQRVDALQDNVVAGQKLKAGRGAASFEMGAGRRLGKTVLELVDVTKGYDGPPLIEDFSLIVRKGERIGLIGANGCGKTTLMRLVADELEPDSGQVIRGKNTLIAYFDQHRSALDLDASVRATVCPDGQDVFVGGKAMHFASWLAKFGFHTEQHRMKVGKLSGGERNRLALARFLQTDANLLIFDEPTNDLDLMTMHVLEEALNAFPGVVLVVSHDRYFLNRVATAILAFERLPDEATTISVIQGDYTTYRRLRKDALDKARADASARQKAVKAAKASKTGAEATASKKAARPKGLTHAETQEIADLEPAIEQAEAALGMVDAALANPDVWAGDGADGKTLQRERDERQDDVGRLYARWEALEKKRGKG